MYNDPEPWELMGWHYVATREDANRIQERWNVCQEHIAAVVSEECLAQIRSTAQVNRPGQDLLMYTNIKPVVEQHFILVRRAKERAKEIIEEVLGRSITVADSFE